MAAPRRWYIITILGVPVASSRNRRRSERDVYKAALAAARRILDGKQSPGEFPIELLAAPLECAKQTWDLPTLKAVHGDSVELLCRWTPETALQEQSRRRAAKSHRKGANR